jgi:hypothetical protein
VVDAGAGAVGYVAVGVVGFLGGLDIVVVYGWLQEGKGVTLVENDVRAQRLRNHVAYAKPFNSARPSV